MKSCSIVGCDGKHVARGYCRKHYTRWWSGNDVEEKSCYEKTNEERFLDSFLVGRKSECWEWNKSCTSFGHGHFWVNGKLDGAHRFSYEYFIGPIPDGLCVCHHCDNPPCVNPGHLFVGTKKDNTQDCIKKNRRPSFVGENNGRSKLVEADILMIRERVASGDVHRVVAERFGVSTTVVGHIVSGKLWSHV